MASMKLYCGRGETRKILLEPFAGILIAMATQHEVKSDCV